MSKETPMMKQYLEIKEQHPNEFVFYRLGDFYEMFFKDAVMASKILKINLTKRNKNSDIPMAGIPHHAAETYIAKLISEGHSVVICEQTEQAQKGQLVNREVTRIITPSTVTEEELVDPSDAINLVSIDKMYNYYGLASLNMSNGQFIIYKEKKLNDIINIIRKINPSEIIYSDEYKSDFCLEQFKGSKTLNPSFYNLKNNEFELKNQNLLPKKYQDKQDYASSINSAGSVLKYILHTQKHNLPYVKELTTEDDLNKLYLDSVSVKNLELVKNSEGENKKTLFTTLNETNTAIGSRKLKEWILNPENNQKIINKRLENVEMIIKSEIQEEISSILEYIPDIERILTRISINTAKPRDLSNLKNVLDKTPELFNILIENNIFENSLFDLSLTKEPLYLIDQMIIDTPPLLLKDGGVIKDGFDKELDDLRNISDNSEDYLLSVEEREKSNSGISKLKLSYNKSDGFYISVPKSKVELVPSNYMIKKTLKNENRYTIEELQPLEEKILTANSKALTREKVLFDELIKKLKSFISMLNDFSNFLSEVDVINNFAFISSERNYCKPSFDNKSYYIEEGKHPVIEKYGVDDFVPNDFLIEDKKLILLTGANMGGKSTYMRQNAIIVLMAHMGCFVPAKKASLRITDRIFTRIGSGDNLSEGKSTFMLEMTEMANILNNATNKSFILVDEIGRGTSTFDGLSLAWSFAEELSNLCETIFSTHYFELTHLEDENDNVINMFMESLKFRNEIIFLHKIEKGFVDQSYGLEVAKIAGIEERIIENAMNKLNNLKNDDIIKYTLNNNVFNKLNSLNIDELSYDDAINVIKNIKENLK